MTHKDNKKLNSIVILQSESTAQLLPIADNLEANHNVINIQLFNSTLQKETERLYNLLSKHKERFVIIAHSFNAFIAILFAEKYEKYVKHIILLSCPSFDDEHDSAKLSHNKSALVMEILELRRTKKLIDAIKNVKAPITFMHGKHDPNPYYGVQDVLNENNVDFEFILSDKCGATPWNDSIHANSFFRMLNVLVNEF